VSVQREDLEQAALIGVFEWKRAHPDEDEPGWVGGLRIRINGSIIDELRREDWLPRRIRVAGRFAASPLRVVGCADVDIDWEARWSNNAEGADLVLERKQTVAEALRAPMISRDAEVVRLSYFRGMMLKDIAHRFGCAAPRVTQRHDRAIAVMRAHLRGDLAAIHRAERSAALSKRREKAKP
jgi:RNA polymerase sigma factor (sigma-70 family)